MIRWLSLVGVLGASLSAAQEAPVVKYDTLAREIQKHRGKVVAVYFWDEH